MRETIPEDVMQTACDVMGDVHLAFLEHQMTDAPAVEVVARAILAERERCASLIEGLSDNPSEIRLHMGEMTAQEMRSVAAAMKWVAERIRTSG